jgi:hypothetical protein
VSGLKGFQIGWQDRTQDGAAVIPEAAERPAQSVERDECFLGNQITDVSFEAGFDQVELLAGCGMAQRSPPQITREFEATTALTDELVSQIALAASDLPQLLFAALLIVGPYTCLMPALYLPK